jgi:Zn-finger nucleic acid-binding protein
MQCPNDGTALVMTERSGVEIDYCPKCRGVWLDRGELDKIIDRSESQAPAARSVPETARQPEPHRSYGDDRHHTKPYRKKREGFLGDIFDF